MNPAVRSTGVVCSCGLRGRLSSKVWQTDEQAGRDVDWYECAAGHTFEAAIPLTTCHCVEPPHAVRADI